MKRIWILGAADPEMNAIEALLRREGGRVLYAVALGRDGKPGRVAPFAAYRAVGVSDRPDPQGDEDIVPGAELPAFAREAGFERVVLVECDVPGAEWGGLDVVRVDHHNPGDPGHGAPPAQFWEASSLGQVYRLLGLTAPPDDHVMAAAADHCLAAAYAGRCPGVASERLQAWRAESKARFQGRDVEAVLADFYTAVDMFRLAPRVRFAGVECADFREVPSPKEAPEASAILGVPFVSFLPAGHPALRGAPARVSIMGAGSGTPAGEAPVAAFLAVARKGAVLGFRVHADGRWKPYGDPSRGFAGAYIVPCEKCGAPATDHCRDVGPCPPPLCDECARLEEMLRDELAAEAVELAMERAYGGEDRCD